MTNLFFKESMPYMTFDWPLQPPFLTAKCRPAWVNRTTLLQLDFVQLLWHLFYLSHFSRLYKTALQSVSRVLGRVWRSPTLIGSHKDNFLSTFRYKKMGMNPFSWALYGELLVKSFVLRQTRQKWRQQAPSLLPVGKKTLLRIHTSIWSPCTSTPYCLAPFLLR